jgi:hypothetical protein
VAVSRPLQNALIDVGTLSRKSGSFTFGLAPSTSQAVFFIRLVGPTGAPVTVPFVVNDTYGTWKTLTTSSDAS